MSSTFDRMNGLNYPQMNSENLYGRHPFYNNVPNSFFPANHYRNNNYFYREQYPYGHDSHLHHSVPGRTYSQESYSQESQKLNIGQESYSPKKQHEGRNIETSLNEIEKILPDIVKQQVQDDLSDASQDGPEAYSRSFHPPAQMYNGYNHQAVGSEVEDQKNETHHQGEIYAWMKTSPQNSKSKRTRQTYTHAQTFKLEVQFNSSEYLNKLRREELSRETGLTQKQIKVWFQNRRMKRKNELKKDVEKTKTFSVPPSGDQQEVLSYPNPALIQQDHLAMMDQPLWM